MHRWGMAINLKRCVGCRACVVACKVGHGLPPGVNWSRVDEKVLGYFPFLKLEFLPTLCMQCERPSCLEACPTGATYQRDDSIVLVDAHRCVGCGRYVMACPYGARSIVSCLKSYHSTGDLTPYEQIAFADHKEGLAEKCTFYSDRVDRGEQPICVINCPAHARIFGDLKDMNSEVSTLLESRDAEQLLPEVGNRTTVYYLKETRHID